jgi:dihydrodipicolinate synthase/N-acetylneuraminate lyase
MARQAFPSHGARGRREFLLQIGAGAASLVLSQRGFAAGEKPLRGLFPIGQTPATPDNKLDLDCLAAEGKGGKTAIVIGVQTLDDGTSGAVEYAKHAARLGADAIISLPPGKADADAMVEYYKTLGRATDLPLFVQSTGNMSVDLLVRMFQEIPTMRVVKDEAGNPLQRVAEIRERTGGKLNVFSGNGVRTMITEMERGFAGHCPTVGMADVYQQAFDLWHSGKKREAFDMFGRVLAFDSIPNAASYVLIARGIFKEDTITRPMSLPGSAPSGGGRRPAPPLDEASKREIREALSTYLKPYLRG